MIKEMVSGFITRRRARSRDVDVESLFWMDDLRRALLADTHYRQYVRAIWIKAVFRVVIIWVFVFAFSVNDKLFIRDHPYLLVILLLGYPYLEIFALNWKKSRAANALFTKVARQNGILWNHWNQSNSVDKKHEKQVDALNNLLKRIEP